jgi:hypothetical protein
MLVAEGPSAQASEQKSWRSPPSSGLGLGDDWKIWGQFRISDPSVKVSIVSFFVRCATFALHQQTTLLSDSRVVRQ